MGGFIGRICWNDGAMLSYRVMASSGSGAEMAKIRRGWQAPGRPIGPPCWLKHALGAGGPAGGWLSDGWVV